MRRRIAPSLLCWLVLTCPAPAQDSPDQAPISGYAFMEPATRELQDDDFLNPAFFLVEEGLALWNADWPGASGQDRACRACHGAPESLRGVAARYPVSDPESGGMVNLELRINREIAEHLGAAPLPYESQELLALAALVGYQSRGMPMQLNLDETALAWAERGRQIFETRRGQLNLSCRNCHQDHWGEKLRGDVISQGQVNAFPIFRLTWDEVGSRHRMFTWCMEAVRAEPHASGSDAYLALETYLVLRGQGLPVETPGVRR